MLGIKRPRGTTRHPRHALARTTSIIMSQPPVRIQRKRTKGWRMPPNTISVCRPGKWGNPFIVGRRVILVHDVTYEECWKAGSMVVTPHLAVELYRTWIEASYERCRQAKLELSGRNLACFCPLDKPCHADVLLSIANS
jgi:hypothetical protein